MIYIILLISLFFFIVYTNRISNDKCSNIAHGCGSINSTVLTNCIEAFNNSYNHGYLNIEIDLLVTNDCHIVAAHDWIRFKRLSNYNGSGVPSFSFIKSSKILNCCSVIYDNRINYLFKKFKNVKIFTDKITDYKLLTNYINYNRRLYVEVFNYHQYLESKRYGFMNVMLNIRNSNDLKQLVLNNNKSITTITIGSEIFYKNKFLLKKLFMNDVKIYAYGVNNKKDIYNAFCKYVNGFYIDFT